MPLFAEAGPDGVDFDAGGGGVGAGGEGVGFGAGELEERAIAEEIGDAELRGACLAGAEELAGAALLEVKLGEGEAVGGGDEGVEAGFRSFGDAIAGDEEAVALLRATADAAAELMELREAEALGVIDDHEGGVGDVDADFDHGGGDEDVEVAASELAHGDLFFGGCEPAVEEAKAEAGEGAVAELVEHVRGGAEFLFGEERGGFGSLLLCRFLRSLSRSLAGAACCFGDEAGGDGVGAGVAGG